MGNTLLAYPDRTSDATTTFAGGSWQAGLPLINLQNRLLSKVARSTNATAAYTQFVVTLTSPRDVRVIGILGHNISLAGTIRVRGYSDAGLTALVYDTGTQYAWPQTFTTDDVAVQPNNWIWPLPTIATARYWLVEVVDTGNAAGYVQIGRCWLGPAWVPDCGVVYGVNIGYESRSVVSESLGGVIWGNRRTPRRAETISFPSLSMSEMRTALIIQKVLDTTGELIIVLDNTMGAEDLLLHAFPATPRKLSPLRMARFNANEMPMELIENV